MLALYSIIVAPDGQFAQQQGTLFQLPPELTDQHRINQYLKNLSEGWSVSEMGYLMFQKTTKTGTRYIFPGLFLKDGPKPSKKFYGYKPNLTKPEVEKYVHAHIERNESFKRQAEQEMTALVHDLRHLSSAIYHSAEQAQRAFKDHDRAQLNDGLQTIIATQTMLKARINYLDYVSGVDRFDTETKINVFSRVDKVIKCFKASANDKGVELKLLGQSFRIATGPNILEIVPYTLVDNAIKYSPRNYEIEVSVYDTDTQTNVSVASVGPTILPSERDSIFERGARGSCARKVRPAGTGLGLAVAKEIVEKFDGTFEVTDLGQNRDIDGVPHSQVVFRFSVPTAGEDTKRLARFSAGRTRRLRK